jgi:hypothetical protein
MKIRSLTTEHLLFGCAFLLGLALRMWSLGAAPLNDAEAGWALQALKLGGGGQATIGSIPGYIIPTGALFDLFSSTNALARFLPALAGSLLVIFPFLISRPDRPHLLGRDAALIMAFGLALDPGLVAVSRQAGGPMMALSFTLLAVGCLFIQQPVLAGILAGLALLSGPAAITGILILTTVWGIAIWIHSSQARKTAYFQANDQEQSIAGPALENESSVRLPPIRWPRVLIASGLTILLVGTSLFRFPQGLAGWLNTLTDYFDSWVTPSNIPALRLLAAVLFYQPIATIFGMLGIIRGLVIPANTRERFVTVLCSTWLIVGLLLVLLPTGRQVSNLVWILVPLWIMAACELAQYVPGRSTHPLAVIQALVTTVLIGLLWYTLSVSSHPSMTPSGMTPSETRIAIVVGILALGGLLALLIGIGWGWEVGKRGLVWGVVLGLGIYSTSALWGAAYVRPNQPQELWGTNPAIADAGTLFKTIQWLSSLNTGRVESIDIISEIDSPAMHWFLREFPNTRFSSFPPADEMNSLLITPAEGETPALVSSYRGQSFTWTVSPGWSGALPEDFIRWFNYREAPLWREKIILWARSDLFSDSNLPPQTDFNQPLVNEEQP